MQPSKNNSIQSYFEELVITDWRVSAIHSIPDPKVLSDQPARLYLVAKGQLPFEHPSDQDILTPTTALYLPRGASVLVSPTGMTDYLSLAFFEDYIRFVRTRSQGHTATNEWLHTTVGAGSIGDQQLKALSSFLQLTPRTGAEIPALHAMLLLTRTILGRSGRPTMGKAKRSCIAVRDYIRENCHLPINRSSVAKVFNLNPSYLSRLFSEQMETTFNKYLVSMRMERAALLLRTTRREVTLLAKECGFVDHVYFTKVFREFYGTPPGRFRNQAM